uniref:Uncharacterized protein n=1 Tax=Arundo donax TaxID=35708 RepID=A0A0A9FCK5_ARUDO
MWKLVHLIFGSFYGFKLRIFYFHNNDRYISFY